jgi:hypothetical protein
MLGSSGVAAQLATSEEGLSTMNLSYLVSCVVDLWQSLSEWRLFLSERVLVCRRENVRA